MTVQELIDRLGGELISGDASRQLTGVAEVSLAGGDQLVFGESAAPAERAMASNAGAAVVPLSFHPAGERGTVAVVVTSQPRLWFAQAAKLMAGSASRFGAHAAAVISPAARLAPDVSIGPGAVVAAGAVIGARSQIEAGAVIGESVTIGEDCLIHPRAVLYPGTALGDRVVVHAGAVLGADGFGYVRDNASGAYTQFPQQGRLILEDDVEIGANTTIDRGALGETRIRRGAKLDNLVHIGHNCDIGEDVVIAAQTGISGSSSVGKGAILAGQVGIGDHAHIGEGVILGGQAGVLPGKSLTTRGSVLWGTPAKPLREYLREIATLARLSRRRKD